MIHPRMLKALRRHIAAWLAQGAEAGLAGNAALAAIYEQDARDLEHLLGHVEAGRYTQAAQTLRRLDAIVRDQIPPPLYQALDRLPVQDDQDPARASRRLEQAARSLIELLGEPVAAAVAAKCQVTYGGRPADHDSARLGQVIIRVMGVDRYNELDVL